MFGSRLFRSSSRTSLVWYLALSLFVVQGLKVHFHTFSGHEQLHGHGHEIELHIGGGTTDSGHDDVGESGFSKYAVLKLKNAQTDNLALPVIAAVLMLFGFVLTGHAPWRPGRLFRPATGGDVRIPPLRAPPR